MRPEENVQEGGPESGGDSDRGSGETHREGRREGGGGERDRRFLEKHFENETILNLVTENVWSPSTGLGSSFRLSCKSGYGE